MKESKTPRGKRIWRIALELIIEAIVIIAILMIGYFGLLFVFLSASDLLYPYLVTHYPYYALIFPQIQQHAIVIFTLIYGVASIGIVIWRVVRRFRTIQMGFILDELHYISKGHYDYKISDRHVKSMKPVVESINRLVNHTVRAMDEERKIEQSKDELIANMSHDIRTPLTSIIGYIGLIQSGRFKDKDEAMHYATIAYNKSLQLQGMVEDLFEYTKVSQINFQVHPERVNVIRLLEQLAVEYEIEAEQAGREIEIVSDEADVYVELDSEKIVRVFSNLMTNALKYGGSGTYIRIYVDQQASETRFSVENDGNQIPQEQLELLFQRFYRADQSRSSKGSGLGLAIAESIVRSHHGKIWAESDAESTRFIFVLPNVQPDEEEAEHATATE